MRKMPVSVWVVSSVLAGLRFLAFWEINSSVRRDVAQWQLSYIPLMLADLPISVGYLFCRVPFPIGEAVIGPMWWFALPIVVWRLRVMWHTRRRKNDA